MPIVMSLFGGAMKLVSTAFAFLKKLEPFQLLSLALGVACFVLVIQRNDARSDARHWKAKSAELTQLRKTDRANYEAAQDEARRRNVETVKKIEERNEAITDRVRSDYQRDLQRLRLQSKANRGSPGGPGVSQVPQAPGGVDDSPGVCVSGEDALRSAETELKLLHLQSWIREQTR